MENAMAKLWQEIPYKNQVDAGYEGIYTFYSKFRTYAEALIVDMERDEHSAVIEDCYELINELEKFRELAIKYSHKEAELECAKQNYAKGITKE